MEELFTGGLVTSELPEALQPGELSVATNGFYFPEQSGISRAPGWTTWCPASATASGMGSNPYVGISSFYLPPRGETYALLLDDHSIYGTALASSSTAIFASAYACSATGATSLTTATYNDKCFLFNGIENTVFKASGSASAGFRPHGLGPVAVAPTSATSSTTFSQSATGYWEYWFTEVAKYADDDEIEGTYSASKPLTVNVTAIGNAPKIYLPTTPSNATTTHYRLYRSTTTKTAATDSVYPSGEAIADIATANASGGFVDGGSAGNATAAFSTTDGYVHSYIASASAAMAAGGAAATYTHVYANHTDWRYKSPAFMLYAPAASVTGNITGLGVDIVLRSSVPSHFQVSAFVGRREVVTLGSQTVHRFTTLPFTASNPNSLYGASLGSDGLATPGIYGGKAVNMADVGASYVTASLGGQYDDWLPSDYDWTADDFSGNFGVMVLIKNTNGLTSNGDVLEIDYVKLTIYNNGKDASVGQVYDVINVAVGDVVGSSGSHGKPPVANIGCVYEGSLVTNDVNTPGVVAYSVPGFPEYFPSLYQLRLPTTFPITYIGTVNKVLIAATSSSIWRINYLPNEDDASFSRGRAVELVTDTFGIVGPECATLIIAEDGHQEIVGASYNGIYATDGFGHRPLNLDIKWQEGLFINTLVPDSTGIAALINHPQTQSLRLFLNDPTAAANPSYYYQLSYAPRHRKQITGVKWAGPVYYSDLSNGNYVATVKAAHTIRFPNGGSKLVTVLDDPIGGAPRLLREQIVGNTEQLSLPQGGVLSIRTRVIPLGGDNIHEATVNGIYLTGSENTYLGGYGTETAPAVGIAAFQYKADHDINSSYVVVATSTGTSRTTYAPLGAVSCTGLAMGITQSASATYMTLYKMGIVGESYGEQES